jgi:hypothetical protein
MFKIISLHQSVKNKVIPYTINKLLLLTYLSVSKCKNDDMYALLNCINLAHLAMQWNIERNQSFNSVYDYTAIIVLA